jgi:ribonucleotide monophosphatase NagD (HAD superfamily)
MITAVERLGDGQRTLVIGDRIDTDGAAAAAARLDFAIVLTGGADRAELEAAKDPLKPVEVADTLAALVAGGGPR